MKKFIVNIKEIHFLPMEVQARSKKEAREIASDKYNCSDFDLSDLQYLSTFDVNKWKITKMDFFAD